MVSIEATIPAAMTPFDPASVRSRFPGLYTTWALFDNAGGTVPCHGVIERVHAYLSGPMVQHGASYAVSVRAVEAVEQGRAAMASLMGAQPDEVVLGPSSTALLGRLAATLAPQLGPGDEVVVTNLDHESNVGCWRRLAEERGATVREWTFDADSLALTLEGLEAVLSEDTKIVAFGHVSNLIGQIHDAGALCARIRAAGALSIVDGVAYAPHRRPDVRQFGCDAYVFSTYKVFGPHQSVLWIDPRVELGSVNHFFVEGRPGTLEPGGVVHELVAGLPGMVEYLSSLGEGDDEEARLDSAFRAIAEVESSLAAPLLGFLAEQPSLKVLGPASADAALRVPTVSFVVDDRAASALPPLLDEREVAIRWGHFYAYRAARDLGLLESDGVVRASLVHYNTPEEVERLIDGLAAVL